MFHNTLEIKWHYESYGTYVRKTDNRRIQRYRCLSCKRTFSTQTFSTTYWQKRPYLDSTIFMKTVGGMGNRQIAREIKVAPSTIDRKLARMGRHCLLFLTQLQELAPPIHEIVFDGFETFELSHYYPFHHNLVVEKDSNYLLYFNDSELRRKGSMTKYQKPRRAFLENKYGVPDPKAIETAITELLETVMKDQGHVIVHTDDHPQYRNAIRAFGNQISHIVTPGKNRRDTKNFLFVINLLDRLLRHSSANHRRKTIAWSKRRQASCERLAIFAVWRNTIKVQNEKHPKTSDTPAMSRGMLDHPLTIEEVFNKRLFIRHFKLPKSWEKYYRRVVSTRAIGRECHHNAVYTE